MSTYGDGTYGSGTYGGAGVPVSGGAAPALAATLAGVAGPPVRAPVTPCFALPFRVGPDGDFAVVEQDSMSDIVSCVAILVGTERGSRLEVPDYGVTDPTFSTRLNTPEIISQTRRYEPRAALLVSGQFLDAFTEQVTALVDKAGQQLP